MNLISTLYRLTTFIAVLVTLSTAFTTPIATNVSIASKSSTVLKATSNTFSKATRSRRAFVASISSSLVLSLGSSVLAATADESAPQDTYEALLLLLRAQESTSQELNLLKTGKYKNFQRANVKVSVRSGSTRLSEITIAHGRFARRFTFNEITSTQVRLARRYTFNEITIT